MKKKSNIFKVAPNFMLRSAMLPLESIIKVKTDHEHYSSLEQFLDGGFMNEALLIASPALSAMLEKDKLKPKEEKKVAAGLFKYVSRTFSRATPFGLFACVGTGKFDSTQKIPVYEDLQMKKRSRIDMEWLLGFINQLETNDNVALQLKVKANHAIRIAGNRLELVFPTHCGQGEELEGDKTDTISVRLTAASKYVLEKAENPILLNDLVQAVFEKYNGEIDISVVHNFVLEMFRQEFLISELRPPLLGGNPVEYLLEKLAYVTGIETEREILRQLQCMIHVYDNTAIGNGISNYLEIDQKMRSIVSSKSSLQVDTSFLNKLSINTNVADSLAEAAEIMWRVSTVDRGFPYIRDYYLKFIDRYGTASDVPLLDLINDNIGIGYPLYDSAGKSTSTVSKDKQAKLTKRRRVLSEQIATSIMENFSEVILDENLIDKLTIKDNWEYEMPDSMEIYAEILASSKEAVNQGSYTIVINPSSGSFQNGLTLGRFADVLGEDINQTLENMSVNNQDLNENMIMVDVTYIPTYGRTANIMMSRNYLPYEMAIGTNIQKEKQTVRLDDLYVSADHERLFLKSKTYGKEVAVVASNMLNFTSSPYLFRLLKDLSFEGKYYWQPFEWSFGSEQVFLPRLRYKNVIITSAQWNFNKDMFNKSDFHSEEIFFEAFQYAAKKWKLPQYVYLKMADNHILLNLAAKEAVALLKKDLEKDKTIRLEELVGNFDERTIIEGAAGHYMTEVVFEVEAANRKKRIGEDYPLIKYDLTNTSLLFPCQEWLYVNLYCPANIQNEFLTNTVAPFSGTLMIEHTITQWFFIRFVDQKPHIRLRFRLGKVCRGENLLSQVLEWMNLCKDNGYIFDAAIHPYERETARYGGPQLISMAETVFCQDSQAVIRLLSIFKKIDIKKQIFIGAWSAISILMDLGFHRRAQLEMLDKYVNNNKYKQEFRAMKAQFFSVMSQEYNSGAMNYERDVLEAFAFRTEALKIYGRLLHQHSENLWNDVYDIVSGLLHMDFNRLFGIDREKEEQCLSLARHAIHAFMEYEKHIDHTV